MIETHLGLMTKVGYLLKKKRQHTNIFVKMVTMLIGNIV